jgi:hypothetical protein
MSQEISEVEEEGNGVARMFHEKIKIKCSDAQRKKKRPNHTVCCKMDRFNPFCTVSCGVYFPAAFLELMVRMITENR